MYGGLVIPMRSIQCSGITHTNCCNSSGSELPISLPQAPVSSLVIHSSTTPSTNNRILCICICISHSASQIRQCRQSTFSWHAQQMCRSGSGVCSSKHSHNKHNCTVVISRSYTQPDYYYVCLLCIHWVCAVCCLHACMQKHTHRPLHN